MALTVIPSRVSTYEVISRYDSDLAVPEVPVRGVGEDDDAWAARAKAYQAQVDTFIRELTVARETGNYEPVLKAGANPTRFRMRQIPGDRWQVLLRIAQHYTDLERASLIVRLALVEVTNWIPGFEVGKPVEHLGADGKPSGLGRVAPIEVVRAFYAAASGSDADDLLLDLGEQVAAHRLRYSGN